MLSINFLILPAIQFFRIFSKNRQPIPMVVAIYFPIPKTKNKTVREKKDKSPVTCRVKK